MTTPTEAELAEFARNADELRGELGRYAGSINAGASRSEIHQHVHQDSRAAIIAAASCAVMLVVALFLSMWLLNEFRRYDDEVTKLQQRINVLDAKINVVYQHAPQLKTEPNKER